MTVALRWVSASSNEGALLTSTGSGTAPPDDVSFDGEVRLGIELFGVSTSAGWRPAD